MYGTFNSKRTKQVSKFSSKAQRLYKLSRAIQSAQSVLTPTKIKRQTCTIRNPEHLVYQIKRQIKLRSRQTRNKDYKPPSKAHATIAQTLHMLSTSEDLPIRLIRHKNIWIRNPSTRSNSLISRATLRRANLHSTSPEQAKHLSSLSLLEALPPRQSHTSLFNQRSQIMAATEPPVNIQSRPPPLSMVVIGDIHPSNGEIQFSNGEQNFSNRPHLRLANSRLISTFKSSVHGGSTVSLTHNFRRKTTTQKRSSKSSNLL